MSIALVITAALALIVESPVQLPDTPTELFAVLWLGVFGSSLAYLIYFRLVHVMGPTRISLITYVMPIVGIVLGVSSWTSRSTCARSSARRSSSAGSAW